MGRSRCLIAREFRGRYAGLVEVSWALLAVTNKYTSVYHTVAILEHLQRRGRLVLPPRPRTLANRPLGTRYRSSRQPKMLMPHHRDAARLHRRLEEASPTQVLLCPSWKGDDIKGALRAVPCD